MKKLNPYLAYLKATKKNENSNSIPEKPIFTVEVEDDKTKGIIIDETTEGKEDVKEAKVEEMEVEETFFNRRNKNQRK